MAEAINQTTFQKQNRCHRSEGQLVGSLTCMCSVWGTTYYLLTFGFTDPVSWIKLVAITGKGLDAIIDTYLTIVIVLQKDTHEFSKQEHPAQ